MSTITAKKEPRSYASFLLDGNSFCRAAFDPQHPGSMIHRVGQRILTLSTKGRVVVAWDTPSERRIERFPDYKIARRSRIWEHRDAYSAERASLQRLLRMIGIGQAMSPGWEADDVLATLAKKWDGPHQIQTRDEDLLQTIAANTDVLLIKGDKEHLYDVEEFLSERGFMPSGIIAHKALAGDSSDSVPGVKGLGDGAANEIVSKYPEFVDSVVQGTWQKSFDDMDLSTRVRNLARKAAADPGHLDLMRWVVTAKTDVRLVWAAPIKDRGVLAGTLSRWGLRVLAQRLGVV